MMHSSLPATLLLLAAFFVAFAMAYGAIVALRRWWPARLGHDAPDGVRKLQRAPVLRVGGLALYLVFLFSFLLIWALSPQAGVGEADLLGWPFLLFGALLFIVGFGDDLFGISAPVRLFVQIAVGVGAYFSGMSIDLLSHPFGDTSLETGNFGLLLTVAWFVAIPNLINLIDGMDGIAGGIGLFLSLTLAVVGWMSGNPPLLFFSVMMAGGIGAFLCFNLPPAKIYMGDGGAYLIGYYIAAASLVTSNKGAVSSALLVVIVALGFPILDTLLAMIRRGITGVPLMAPDALHLHHRLQTLGISKRNLVFVLYGVFAVLSLLGLSVFLSAGYSLPIVGMILVIAFFGALRFLGLPRSIAAAKRSVREMIAARKDVRYAYVMSQVLSHDLDRVRDGAVYWGQVTDFLSKLGIEPVPTDIEETGPTRRLQQSGDSCLVVYRLTDTLVWKLCCPVPSSSRREWDRVLRCLHPGLMAGIAKYGDPPPELGVWSDHRGDHLHLESALNGESPVGHAAHPLQERIERWNGASEEVVGR